jgi:hypothetical protein
MARLEVSSACSTLGERKRLCVALSKPNKLVTQELHTWLVLLSLLCFFFSLLLLFQPLLLPLFLPLSFLLSFLLPLAFFTLAKLRLRFIRFFFFRKNTLISLSTMSTGILLDRMKLHFLLFPPFCLAYFSGLCCAFGRSPPCISEYTCPSGWGGIARPPVPDEERDFGVVRSALGFNSGMSILLRWTFRLVGGA